MIGERNDLPRYKKPPVVEVAIGVQFRRLDDMKSAYYGAFWDVVREKYSETQDQAPLLDAPQPELLDSPPLRRVWFVSKDGQYLIQVQPDRFIHNWRKNADAPYPSFLVGKKMFYESLERFRAFVTDAKLGQLHPMKYEVTYVNHIVPGTGKLPVAIEEYFPCFNWKAARSEKYLPDPQALAMNLSFPYGEDSLVISIRHGVGTDKKEILQLDFSARGPLTDDALALDNLDARLEAGHERIVRGFTDLSTANAHKLWERTK